MKLKSTFAGLLTVISVASCCGNKAVANTSITVDSVKYEKNDKAVELSIVADYPTLASASLKTAISEYISEELGGTYMGSLESGDSIVAFYGKTLHDSLLKEHEECGIPVSFCSMMAVRKTYETENYVTYTAENYMYQGGAHGSTTLSGITFRKTDGRRFGYEMLRNTESEAFHALLRDGVKEYFQMQGMNGDLKDVLMGVDNIDYMPLPVTEPYLTDRGMMFVYQQYEIAPYAAGMPSFVIPFNKIKPYLTATVLKMIN